MEYSDFLEELMIYKKINEELSELHEIGFDFYEGKYKISDKIEKMFLIFLRTHFTEEGVDWIVWFVFENEYGQKDWSKIKSFKFENGKSVENDLNSKYGARDENGNPICYSFESTWEYVKKYLKS
jgi:hypothetical protein